MEKKWKPHPSTSHQRTLTLMGKTFSRNGGKFTEQLSCRQKIFVVFYTATATEKDVTSEIGEFMTA